MAERPFLQVIPARRRALPPMPVNVVAIGILRNSATCETLLWQKAGKGSETL
jgi:hypothetical protein